MSLPRACHICQGVHRPGERCTVAERQRDQRRGTSTQRYGAGWGQISRQILKRDHHICQLQLPGCTGRADTVDHITARANGGPSTEDNLVAACRHCNSRKGSHTA